MKRTTALAITLVFALGLAACGGDDDDGGGADGSSASNEPFVLGLAIAKSGTASSFDGPPVQGLELRVDQLNREGGIDGREIKLITSDTQSDPARGASAATELIERGADALAVTCDFDFGSPAAIAAAGENVPSISLCASDPKFADVKTIGPMAFTMGTGTDAKASIAAEYAYEDRDWRSAYILQDTSIEYTKSLGKYFEARFTELGGEIVGTDTFNGLESAEVPAQVTKLRNLSQQPDLIYLPAFIPPAATVIRQIRDAGIETPSCPLHRLTTRYCRRSSTGHETSTRLRTAAWPTARATTTRRSPPSTRTSRRCSASRRSPRTPSRGTSS